MATPPIVAPGAFVAIDAGYCRVRRPSFAIGYNSAATIVQVLKQAADDLSRENIMQEDAFVMVALASIKWDRYREELATSLAIMEA